MSRIRADRYTNRLGTGAPVFSNGVNITGNVGVGTTVPTSKLTVVGNMNVTGTVSVGGTLTYEDVTSIDSVGVITARSGIDATGHVLPTANNTYDLGSVTKGWRNVYSNDLNLSNMNGDSNDIDGTNGSWTIQEGKYDLFLINRLTGRKYKFNLTEVS